MTATKKEETGTALAERIDQKQEPDKWMQLIGHQRDQYAIALTSTTGTVHIDPDKFARVALTAIRTNPTLQQSDNASLLGAIMGCAQLGLEPHGPLGQAYLVPFKNQGKVETTLIIGYQGLVELAYRSGRVMSIAAHTVHKADEFAWEYGTNAHIVHRPSLEERGDMIGVYAIANLVGGGQAFEVMSKSDVDRIRSFSRGASSEHSPWNKHYEAMARKTALRQLFKWLPSSVENSMALGTDGGVFRDIPNPERPDEWMDIVDVEEVEG